MPIVSVETGEVIAAMVVGIQPVELGAAAGEAGSKAGCGWTAASHADPRPGGAGAAGRPPRRGSGRAPAARSLEVAIGGAPQLVFYRRLNPGSAFPPAYEVWVYPLAGLLARQRQLAGSSAGSPPAPRWGASAPATCSLPALRPVERLAADSGGKPAQRERAEAAWTPPAGSSTLRPLFRRRLPPAQDARGRPARRAGGAAGGRDFTPEVREEIAHWSTRPSASPV